MNQVSSSSDASQFPFETVEGNAFSPVCLKTHWDPTEMLRRILPQQKWACLKIFVHGSKFVKITLRVVL